MIFDPAKRQVQIQEFFEKHKEIAIEEQPNMISLFYLGKSGAHLYDAKDFCGYYQPKDILAMIGACDQMKQVLHDIYAEILGRDSKEI